MKGEKITITTTRSFERVLSNDEVTALILAQFPFGFQPYMKVNFVPSANFGEVIANATYREVVGEESPMPEPKPKRAYTKRQKTETAVSPAVQKARGGFRPRYISPDKKGGEK